jgi:hypothetical protein
MKNHTENAMAANFTYFIISRTNIQRAQESPSSQRTFKEIKEGRAILDPPLAQITHH